MNYFSFAPFLKIFVNHFDTSTGSVQADSLRLYSAHRNTSLCGEKNKTKN